MVYLVHRGKVVIRKPSKYVGSRLPLSVAIAGNTLSFLLSYCWHGVIIYASSVFIKMGVELRRTTPST
jgi:hypothetical protein